jgi:hypothetical protein
MEYKIIQEYNLEDLTLIGLIDLKAQLKRELEKIEELIDKGED